MCHGDAMSLGQKTLISAFDQIKPLYESVRLRDGGGAVAFPTSRQVASFKALMI
jgi:hypothetical protein